MEIKVNKEIRDYTENVFFGLSLRQSSFSALACAVAVLLYFLLKDYLGIEALSWVCIIGAVPFVFFGFFKYNGMTAEEFIIAWIKSEILLPKVLLFKPENLYEEILQEIDKEEIENAKRKRRKNKNS